MAKICPSSSVGKKPFGIARNIITVATSTAAEASTVDSACLSTNDRLLS